MQRLFFALAFSLWLTACDAGTETLRANNDTAQTTSGTAVTIDVLDNDTGSGLTIESYAVTTTNGGTIVKTTSEELRYTSASGYAGTDTFTYVAEDEGGTESNSATVTVNVR